MAAWLELCGVENRDNLWAPGSLAPSFEARSAARMQLMALPGAEALAACERPPFDDENPFEPLVAL